MFKRNPKRIAVAIVGVALVVLSLTSCTENNKYEAKPVQRGVTYQPVDSSENDRDPNGPRNNIECFKVERTWDTGSAEHKVEMGTYCKVHDQ